MNSSVRTYRRRCARLAGLAVLGAAIALGGCDGGGEDGAQDQPGTLLPNVAQSEARARFEAQVGSQFEVLYDAHHRLAAELVSVHKAGAPDPRLDQFTVLFHAPGEPALGERAYRFEHPVLGAFRLFVKPAPDGSGERYYEGAVSILLDETG